MGDIGEMWREERKAYKIRRDKRVEKFNAEIESLSKEGYTVEALTEFQYRINGTLDLFPVNRRFHNIKTKQRGTFRHIKKIIKEQIDRTE